MTVTTITQPPLTTVTTLPVYFCSKAEEVNCTATVSGKAMAFNAEIQWPAQITAESGFMFPPPWATQVIFITLTPIGYKR